MSPTTGFQRDGWRRPVPKARAPFHGLRALLRAFQRWVAKDRYRPERRYMRG